MTVIELLTQAGITYEKKERNNVYIDCPKCGDRKLSISLITGEYHCWDAGCSSVRGHVHDIVGGSGEITPAQGTTTERTLTEEGKKLIEHAMLNVAEVIAFAAKRKLDPKFLAKQGVGYCEVKQAIVFPFRDLKGNIIGAKYKGTNGDQWIVGEEPLLFIPDLKSLKAQKIVLVEGEVDAYTLAQYGIPVAATLGAGKTKGIPLLAGIRQVLIGFDMDDAGEAGTEKFASELGRYRCKRVHWTAKDPNDMLQAAGGEAREAILRCLREAKSLAIDLKSKSLAEAMIEYTQTMVKGPQRISWGYPILDSFTKGIGGGMYIGVLAEAGTGKTTLIINAARNIATAGHNVSICSLEEHPINEVTPKVMSTLVGRNPNGGPFAPEEIEAIKSQVQRVQLYEGDETLDSIIDWIRECYYVHDVKVVFIDYFQLLVPDERDVQLIKATSYQFKKLVKECPDLCIVMILQPKQKQKKFDKNGKEIKEPLDLSDIRGGAAIGQSVDALLTIRVVDGHPNITQLEYKKVRGHTRVSKTDWLGKTTQLVYDHATMRQTEATQHVFGG